jgi:hypothetical protein
MGGKSPVHCIEALGSDFIEDECFSETSFFFDTYTLDETKIGLFYSLLLLNNFYKVRLFMMQSK